MSEASRYWTTNNTGDGPSAGYGANTMQEMLRGLIAIGDSGVMRGRLNELLVTSGSGNVSVASGEALVYGCYYINDAALTVTVPTPTVSTRQDRIILRFGSVAQTVRCVRLAGTEGAGLPALTQTSTTWELQIASISVTTGGVITTTPDTARFVKSPGVGGALDGSTLEWDTTNKVARIKDGGVTAAKLPSPLSLSQYVATAAGSASAGGLYINSTNPGMGFNENDQATDEKMWDINISAKTFFLRTVNDALNTAVNVISIVRGTGTAIASFTIGAALTISGAISAAAAAFTGQISTTQSGGGTSSGVYINAAAPGLGLRESDQGTDEKLWDVSVDGKVFAIRTVNDASNSVVAPFTITRGTGTAVTGITMAANTVVSGTLTANQIPTYIGRQGGSGTDWSTSGTTGYTPTVIKMESGTIDAVLSSGFVNVSITFPVAFTNKPVLFATPQTSSINLSVQFFSVTNSGATMYCQQIGGSSSVTVPVMWMAMGT